nr:conotoxin precursor U [Conus judaeus]
MNRMGFFLMLTVAVLLTSFICTEGAPAENLEVKGRTNDCPENCETCNPDLPCGCCGTVICHASAKLCEAVSNPYEDYENY